VIQSVLGRFQNPPTLLDYPQPDAPMQGPIHLTFCKVGLSWCDEDCDHCLPWLATCENCDEHGHQSGAWVIHESMAGSGSVVTYCEKCAYLLKIDANI